MKSIVKFTFLFLLVPAIALANSDKNKKRHEKSKKVSKTFQVNKGATLSISNKFGNVDVTTWNKNTIEIDVNITVKGNDLDKVEDRLKEVEIEFASNSSLVEAKTILGTKKNSWGWWSKRNKINYEINYTVKMPVTNNANLNNDYGNITLDKLEGEANINCDYGKIIIGDLKGNNTNINLDYCKGSSVKSMKNGSLNLDYTTLEVDNSESIKLNSDYSNLSFNKAKSITFNTDYGNIKANDVSQITGNGDYTTIKVGTLRNNLKINSDYGRISIESLAKGFESVDIKSEYASIKIGVNSGVSFDFIVDLQFAGFRKGNAELFKSIEKNNKKYYEGKYNKGGNSKVTIKSQFGSVTFNDN